MADNETTADIIAEMRGFKRYSASDSSDCRYVAYWLYQTFADRLEAALKRELSKNTSKNGADFGQLGDAAKMREALEAINCINTGGLRRLLAVLVEADIFDGGLINKTISAVEKARRALATISNQNTQED